MLGLKINIYNNTPNKMPYFQAVQIKKYYKEEMPFGNRPLIVGSEHKTVINIWHPSLNWNSTVEKIHWSEVRINFSIKFSNLLLSKVS